MDLLSNLNESQQQAVTHIGSPLMILAGAGSGKTRALTYKAAYLISHHHIDSDRILLTTFTNKAAKEMQNRLEKLTGGKRLNFAGTFHSLCARFLRRYGQQIGLDPNFVIYDQNDQTDAIKLVINELNLDAATVKPRSILAAIESAKNELITPSAYANIASGSFQSLVARIYPRYQALLRRHQAVDFTDLLVLTVDLFTQSESVRNRYHQQLEHILIDEYQDTNRAQYQLTKLWLGPHHNLCVVGDASQSIYSWRGADYTNLLALKTDFPNLTTIKLEQNYRSTQNILNAAYGIIHQNKLHPILELWTDSGQGDPIQIVEVTNEYAEANYIAKEIKAYQHEGHHLADSAVLYRTNAQSRVFEEVFIEQGIPYVLIGGIKFYERKEIKDIIAYLRYAYNPNDKVAYGRMEKLGKRRLLAFISWLENANLNVPPLTLLESVLTASAYLSRFDPHDPEDQSRIENVNELKSVASSFTDVGQFLENLALAEQDTQSKRFLTPESVIEGKDSDAAILMTLHASKGLEFDQVFIAGLEEGIFPHSRSLMSKPELEEERRLCYVGITRARKKLHLSYTKDRMYFGVRGTSVPSRFLDEIPNYITKRISTSKPTVSKPTSAWSDPQLADDLLSGKIDIDTFLNS
jgi:DNA helicase-2/ATP-dependent DNA helicase PcrA